MNIATKPLGCRANYLVAAVLIDLLSGFSYSARSADLNLLRPADTSSPRATLQYYIVIASDSEANSRR